LIYFPSNGKSQFSFSNFLAGIGSFTLISAHIDPDHAPAEISALVDVYNVSVKRWNITDSFLLGDFNADCDYVSIKWDWPKILLWTDKRFTWLIDHDSDTNVAAKTSCAYDRIVVAGENLLGKIVNGSIGVFKFDKVYNLSVDQAKLVSDHYPVELQLMSQPPTEFQPTNDTHSPVKVCSSNGCQISTQGTVPTGVQPSKGKSCAILRTGIYWLYSPLILIIQL
jgi:hypothetical protein